ncbi:MAG: response regulator transcription factor [Gammaproteobacteria bacterium]|uniref:response regulator transcription factor n=1 Tax=Pseudomaricurvus alcaniphilus TaxID=1166482 RepID=UPI00140B6673|nr:response regulator transcription factor [Pseudomaricurvus alcaniphilus]MBR9911742.1 response regulator transcription factor [Gammaproteobacteria bacterium]NHN39162.1 response regulator transcription factor [Pseudomaricurvus alcaniphilus]
MHLLIVEDEIQLQLQVRQQLEALGHTVDSASGGREGLYFAEEYRYDLAIIDLGLPEIDGIELIKRIRAADKDYPILILTARGDWQDKVEGLEAGADDYLTKPFHQQELVARVKALVRRSAGQSSNSWHFGPLTINYDRKLVQLNNETIELTGYEFNTLEYLARHKGKVVSKNELTEYLYAQDFERDSNTIEVFVGRLRKKIELGQKFIHTVRGQGYRFEYPS